MRDLGQVENSKYYVLRIFLDVPLPIIRHLRHRSQLNANKASAKFDADANEDDQSLEEPEEDALNEVIEAVTASNHGGFGQGDPGTQAVTPKFGLGQVKLKRRHRKLKRSWQGLIILAVIFILPLVALCGLRFGFYVWYRNTYDELLAAGRRGLVAQRSEVEVVQLRMHAVACASRTVYYEVCGMGCCRTAG